MMTKPSRALMHPSESLFSSTDNLGRDVLSRLIYGSRYSLMIGFFAVGISVVFGTILGVIAGYYQKLDNIIMRTMDLFMAIPQILLAICIVTALGSGLFNLMLAVGLSSTPQFARVVRASYYQLKNKNLSRLRAQSVLMTQESLSATYCRTRLRP